MLCAAGVALWDVCAAARRAGSLDASIEAADLEVNRLGALLDRHRSIARILFNGQTAARLYERHVLATLTPRARAVDRLVLPSTSPAHASLAYAAKLAAWRSAVAC